MGIPAPMQHGQDARATISSLIEDVSNANGAA